LDENNFIGTFEDLTSMRESPRPSPITSPIETNGITSRANSMVSTTSTITGRPLNLEEVEKAHAQTHLRAAAANNNNADGEREAYYRYETESDESEESDEEYVETFTFAKNIADPKEVLTGQITNNTKALDYLRIIGNDTATECSLHGRNVKIVGKDEDTIKEALNRFRNLQAMFKRRKRPTTIVPCVHYPEPSQFGVYFCPMQKYAHQNWVSTFNQPGTLYFVMLPVTKDRNGNYRKPKDLLAAPPAQHQVQPSPQLVIQQQLSLDERMRQATLEHKRNDFGNQSAGMAPDLTTLWGENKLFRVNSSASGPSSSSKSSTPSNGRMMQPQQPRQQPVNDFPSLPSGSSPKPSIKKQQPNTRRVLRVTNQKASAAVATPQKSNLDIVREYNLHNIKTALEDGLSGVRGFKGKVKLSARLGKVLWTKVNTNLQKQIWEFQDIKDIAMGHRGIEPVFNDM
jgi:ribosomal protein L12E/L44/L45/RPP1/RPP2